MEYLLYITVSLVRLIISFLKIALFIDAILSWFPVNEENPLIRLLDCITGPVLTPARLLIEKSEFLSSFPIDVSFIITYVALTVIGMLLPGIVI